MEHIVHLFQTLGLPIASIVLIASAFVVAKEAWSLLRVQRHSAYEAAFRRTFDELDSRLERFYLPLRERLSVTRHIWSTARNLKVEVVSEPFGAAPKEPGIYIQAENESVFTDMAEREVLIPLNSEIVKLILDNASFRDPSDRINYGAFVTHYLLWSKLWEAYESDTIQRFSAVTVLDFPEAEAERFFETCERLLAERDQARLDALNMRQTSLPVRFKRA